MSAAVASMEQTRGQTDQGVAMVAEVRKALEGISTSARQTAEKVTDIADATHAQSSASDETAKSVDAIACAAEANNSSAEQTVAAIGQLQELARELEQAIAHFKTQ
jgi:methyl-accepting chemotaxis protein